MLNPTNLTPKFMEPYLGNISYHEINSALVQSQRNRDQFNLMLNILYLVPEPCTAVTILAMLPKTLNVIQQEMVIEAARKINYIFNREIILEALKMLRDQMQMSSLALVEHFYQNSGKLAHLFLAVYEKDIRGLNLILADSDVTTLINENFNLVENVLELQTATFDADVKEDIIERIKTANARAVLNSLRPPSTSMTPMLDMALNTPVLKNMTLTSNHSSRSLYTPTYKGNKLQYS